MTKIFVYAANPALAEQTVQTLTTAGAAHAELLETLNIPARQPKENRYLFICETPTEKLADLMPKVLQESEYVADLSKWYETQTQILESYTAHKKRALLVSASQLAGNPTLLVQHINAQWQCQLTAPEPAQPTEVNSKADHLLGYLIQNLIEHTPALQAFENQINELAGINAEPLHEIDAVAGYRALRQQHTELNSQNQRLAIETEELRKEKSDLTAARDSLANATKEAREEAELLINQLHQVQEELEHQFLKNQKTEAKLANQQARWQRLLEKYPNHIETESVRVEVVDSTAETLKWVVHGLEGHGISKEYLEFESFIESSVLGIRLHKTNSRNEPNLKKWPAICEGETIECIPAGKGNDMRQRAMNLLELSASDWKLLNNLPQVIKQHLSTPGLDANLPTRINDAAKKLTVGINALPKTFRYDTVVLKSNKVNPDYEHLWIELQNASYDTYFWPKFEFRLGAANVKLGKFSDHPKIEIPLIDGKTKPFDSWFEESRDEHGGKYELRLDLNRGIFDTETLIKLKDADQKLVLKLAACLPGILENLKSNDLKVGRTKENWKDLAAGTARLICRNESPEK